MSPQIVQLVIFAVAEAVKAYPQLKAEIGAVLSKENPTPADWEALRAKVAEKGYFDFVPDSALPRTAVTDAPLQPGS